jgi:hypothetical protein
MHLYTTPNQKIFTSLVYNLLLKISIVTKIKKLSNESPSRKDRLRSIKPYKFWLIVIYLYNYDKFLDAEILNENVL